MSEYPPVGSPQPGPPQAYQPYPPPPGYPQGYSAPDTIQFGAPPPPPPPPGYYPGYPPPPPPRKRSRTPIFIALGLVVLLVMGGAGIAGAWVWYGWGGTQAEEVMPASVSVFARVDLSPGLGQKLKIDSLAKKFPKDERSTQDFVEKLERDLLKQLELDELDFDTDVKPWFGERIGIGVWSAKADSSPCGLIALASKDDTKAATALDKVRKAKEDRFGFAFLNGYALLAECDEDAQGAATAAAAEAKRDSLAGSSGFSTEVGELPGDQTMLAYADLDKLLDQAGGLGGLFGSDADELNSVEDQLTGRLVLGAKATGSGVDLRFRFANGKKTPSGVKDVLTELDKLTANAVVAAAIRPAVTGGALDDLEKAIRDDGSLGSDADRIIDGVRALADSVVSVAISDFDQDSPALQIVAAAANGDAAGKISALVDTIRDDAGSDLPDVDVAKNGTSVSVTVGDFAGGGQLGNSSLYKEAMGGADGTSIAAAYINMDKLVGELDLSDKDAKYLRPIKAIGFSAGYDGDAAVGLLRVVIK